MFGRLLLLFITIPLIDLVLLIKAGEVLTFWPTVGLVILTGAAGAALAKRQGLATVTRINAELAEGRMPTSELADGVMILLAGALLITPGFITDFFGLALLIPPIRSLFKKWVSRYFQSRIVVAQFDGAVGESYNRRGGAPFGSPFPGAVGADGSVGSERPVKHVTNEALGRTD